MPPANQKRKRNEREFSNINSYDGAGGRPSPHRPNDLPLANHNRGQYAQAQGPQSPQYPQQQAYGGPPNGQGGGRGGRRGGRGGRAGGYGGQQNGGGYDSANAASRGGRFRDINSATSSNNKGSFNETDAVPLGRAQDQPILEQASAPAPPPTPSEPPKSTTGPASRVAQAPSTPRAPPTPQPVGPPKPAGPYDYEYLTEERISNWTSVGKENIIGVATDSLRDGDPMVASTIFQELVRAGIDGKLELEDAGTCVRNILESAPEDGYLDGTSLFLDTLSVLTESDFQNSRLRLIISATGIAPEIMREQLDASLLQSIQVVRPTFNKAFIRHQTGILYRQSNYNLLREETEGYSKLLTELFTTTSDEPPTAEVVENAFENIKALVGAFDLDAGRVLDVLLDVFASLLVKHYRFFVKLLRASSWWPQDQALGNLPASKPVFAGLPAWAEPEHSSWVVEEEDRARMMDMKEQRDIEFWQRAREVGMEAFFELGGRKILSDSNPSDPLTVAKSTDANEEARTAETHTWMKETRTLPPSGNPVAAQLLGFKLRSYASSARDANDTLPVNLIYLSALLIKIGFVSLRDLYSHLWPEDSTMESVKEKQMKEKEERELAKRPGGGKLNALASAGALADDTAPAPMTRVRGADTRATTPSSKVDNPASKNGTPAQTGEKTEDDEEQLPEPSDQKVQLLRSLLCIGAIPEALYLLGRFTWLPDAFPDLPEHLHRILHHSLSKVYDPCRPLHDRSGLGQPATIPDTNQAGIPKGGLRSQEAPAPKVLRWAQLDKNDTGDGVDYKFYWDDWSDNVPICQHVDDVFTLCDTLLAYSGVKIGTDPALIMKLARIGKKSLAEDGSESNKARWIHMCKSLLCPALSLTRASPGLVNEVFDILKCFPTQTRYQVYAEWFLGQTSRLSDVESAFELVKAEARDIMKRMSKTNMKPMARALAKITCASPGIAFAVVLNQIESYENLIDVVVECGRYFTYLGYDVLNWCVVTTLGRAGRSRVTADGITASGWLASLSVFAGRVFKRYSIMSTLPILQYVLEQLRQGNFTDLRVLRELITTMAGIAPDTDFTDAQVQAMAGGELLQAQTLRQLQDKRHENKPSAQRLTKTLMGNGLVGPLLVSIAQQRQLCIFNPDQMSLKVIGENFDDIHIVMSQFLDMIRNNLTIEEFNNLVPDVATLMQEYGIAASVAFTIHRKSIARQIEEYDISHKSTTTKNGRKTSSSKLPLPADVEMTDASAPTSLNEAVDLASAANAIAQDTSNGADGEVDMKIEEVEVVESLMKPASDIQEDPWHPVLRDIISNIQATLSEEFTSSMSLPFFITFWQLSLHDLMAPHKSYTDEDNRQKERIAAINADRSDVTAVAARKKEQEKKTIAEFRNRLVEEMKTHLANYSEVRLRLESEKKHWFKDFKGQFKKLNDALLQECFLPRLLVSPLDSYFSWKMLNFLHSSGTPEFRTNHFLDRLLSEKMLTNLIFHCTAREAECLGRFLSEVFGELSIWHASKATYEKRAWGTKKELPGFVMKLPKDGEPPNLLDFEDFRRLMYKWHTNLTRSLLTCLTNGEYMHIKNAIVVLRCVCRYFPIVNWMGEKLDGVVEQLAKDEKDVRPDIWVASSSLRGNLKARQKEWMLPQAFHQAKQPNRVVPATGTSQPGTPTNGRKPSALSASASEFVPTKQSSVNGITPVPGEVEDGEVEDVQMKDATAGQGSATPDKGNAEIQKAKATLQRRKSSTPATTAPHSLGQRPTPTPTPAPQVAATRPPRPQADRVSSTRGTPQPVRQRPDSRRAPSTRQNDLPNRPDAQSQSRGRDIQHRLSDRAEHKQQVPLAQAGLDRRAELLQQWQGDRHGASPRHDDASRQGTPQSRLRENIARDTYQGAGNLTSRDSHGNHADSRDVTGNSNYHRDEPRAPERPSLNTSNSSQPASQVPINPARAALIQQNDVVTINDRSSSSAADHGFKNEPSSRASDHNTPSDGRRDLYHDSARWESGQASGRSPYQNYNNDQRNAPAVQAGRSRPGYDSSNDVQSNFRAPDRSQGRPTQEPPRVPRHQDMSYGRLNADSSSPPRIQSANDIPISADRRRNIDVNSIPVSTPMITRAPPSGPGGYRQDRAVAQDAGLQANRQRERTPPSQSSTTARPTLNTTSVAPLGPRAAQDRRQDFNAPISPATTRGPPTGPASSLNRPQQNVNRFQGKDVNTPFPPQNAAQPQGGRSDVATINNNHDQGSSIRGRASRQNSQAQPIFGQAPTSQNPINQAPQPARQPLPPQDHIVQAARQGQGMPAQRPRDDAVRNENGRPQGDRPVERNYDSREGHYSVVTGGWVPKQVSGRDTRNNDIRGNRDVRQEPAQLSAQNMNASRNPRMHDYQSNERDSRRTRDRSVNDTSSFAPAPPLQPQQGPPALSGLNSRPVRGDNGPRDGTERNRSRERDYGHNNRDRDSNYRDARDRGPSGSGPGSGTGQSQSLPQSQSQQQQQQGLARMDQPSQDELFQSRTAGGGAGPGSGFGRQGIGGGGGGGGPGDFRGDGRDGRDGRKRGWSSQGEPMIEDNGKRPRRGGGR